MDIIESVESYLAKVGTVYEPAFEGGKINFGANVGQRPVRVKIFLTGDNVLQFRSLLPLTLNSKKARELFVAVNAVNSYIKFGKFVVTGRGIYFETSRYCGKEKKLKDKDIGIFLSASKQTTKDYLIPLSDINDGKLKLGKFMETLI